MSPNSNLSLQVTHEFSASPERVYDAWLDPSKAPKFLFATSSGQMVRVEIDARVGGRFNFTDRRDGQDVEHVGTYLELDRPRRIVFTFGVPSFSPHEDRIVVEIAPKGVGCVVTLTAELRPEFAHMLDRSRKGWDTILGNLDKALSS
jgi:uncharacterized protein YndB with AHSA1/START domain